MPDDGYTPEMAERYFEAAIAPAAHGLGISPATLDAYRAGYLASVEDSPQARAQFVAWAATDFDPKQMPR